MKRAFSMCKHSGCPALLPVPGYCEKHAHKKNENLRAAFKSLDDRKTPESLAFYRSAAWTDASRRHRAKEPLCRRCKGRGFIVAGELVHHNPSREELVEKGLSPFDDCYLETLCHNCHQEDLSAKRSSKVK